MSNKTNNKEVSWLIHSGSIFQLFLTMFFSILKKKDYMFLLLKVKVRECGFESGSNWSFSPDFTIITPLIIGNGPTLTNWTFDNCYCYSGNVTLLLLLLLIASKSIELVNQSVYALTNSQGQGEQSILKSYKLNRSTAECKSKT